MENNQMMMKSFKCRDMDMNCDFQVEGRSEDEVMNKVSDHARTRHSDISLTDQIRNKIRSVIRDVRRPQAA
jgi:predicted small metal-binding protein